MSSKLTTVQCFNVHLYCHISQVKDEIAGSLDFLQAVYGVFGFSFKLYLSTRPEKYMGDIALWDMAEKVIVSVALSHALLLSPLSPSLHLLSSPSFIP